MMIEITKQKVGIIACSGEEMPEGTVTRMASLKVLEKLRPNDTVTLCLPLFLAGGEGDRAFAKFYPTIAIDGCEKRCAYRATEKFSSQPVAGIVVSEIIKQNNFEKPEGNYDLDKNGDFLVEYIAAELAKKVDEFTGNPDKDSSDQEQETNLPQDDQNEVTASCSCGSGIPIQSVVINGQKMDFVALPLIFQNFYQRGKNPDNGFSKEILEMVKLYNPITPELEPIIETAIAEEYAAYWKEQENKS